MLELIEFLVKNLVSNPNEVQLKEIQGETTTIVEVVVDKEDMGYVIGKQGRVINAIRDVVRAGLGRSDKKIIIEVV